MGCDPGLTETMQEKRVDRIDSGYIPTALGPYSAGGWVLVRAMSPCMGMGIPVQIC